MKTLRYFLFSIIWVIGGCASTHPPFGTQAELAQAPVYARYHIPLTPGLIGPSEVEPIMREASQAMGNSKTRAWSSEDLRKISRYLVLCKWAFGYRGESIPVELIGGDKSFFTEGTVYLCVKNSARYKGTVLVHEFGGHGTEEDIPVSVFNPASWFASPSKGVTDEIRAETAVAVFFKRLHVYSGWNPIPELQFFPLDEVGEPELWACFVKGDGNNPKAKAKAFVEKLGGVHSFQELEAFCSAQDCPGWALVWLCCILLEAHYRDLEAVWAFLHTCDDQVLEQQINQILQLMPADLAVKMFIEQRRKLFR